MADSEQKSEREAPRSTTRRRFLTDGARLAGSALVVGLGLGFFGDVVVQFSDSAMVRLILGGNIYSNLV